MMAAFWIYVHGLQLYIYDIIYVYIGIFRKNL